MELTYDNLSALINRQAGYYRERKMQPDEIKRRHQYYTDKYLEYVVECDDGSWIAHYINKKALEIIAAEQGIEIVPQELEFNRKTKKEEKKT